MRHREEGRETRPTKRSLVAGPTNGRRHSRVNMHRRKPGPEPNALSEIEVIAGILIGKVKILDPNTPIPLAIPLVGTSSS
jgi:hypothetical protein